MGLSITPTYCYVDDILCILHNADSVLVQLHKFFPLKLGFGNPSMYLGAKLHETMLHNGARAWAISLAKYVKVAVSNCIVHLLPKYGGKYRMHKTAENPFKMGHGSNLDTCQE